MSNHYSLRQIAAKGRGLVATSRIKTGTTVLEESAVCACLNSSAEENHCAHCFRIHSGASSSYCSEACLNNALGTHQSLLNKCDLSVFDGTTRRFPKLIAQLVSKSMSPQSEAQLDFQSFWGTVLTLAAPQTYIAEAVSEDYQNVMQCFKPVMNEDAHNVIFSSLTLEWYARVEGILHLNAIGLSPRPQIDAPANLNLTASMLNHSCDHSLEIYELATNLIQAYFLMHANQSLLKKK